MKSNKKLLVIIVLLAVAGATVAGGLYLALKTFSSGGENSAEIAPAPKTARPETPAETPVEAADPRIPQPPPGYDGPPPVAVPRGEPIPPELAPGGQQRDGRSVEFRRARREILAYGKEPDWSKFQGQELAAIKRIWERHLIRQNKRQGDRNGDEPEGRGPRTGHANQPRQPQSQPQ